MSDGDTLRDLSRRVDDNTSDIRQLRDTVGTTRDVAIETKLEVKHLAGDVTEVKTIVKDIARDRDERRGGARLGESWRLRSGVIIGAVAVVAAILSAIAALAQLT